MEFYTENFLDNVSRGLRWSPHNIIRNQLKNKDGPPADDINHAHDNHSHAIYTLRQCPNAPANESGWVATIVIGLPAGRTETFFAFEQGFMLSTLRSENIVAVLIKDTLPEDRVIFEYATSAHAGDSHCTSFGERYPALDRWSGTLQSHQWLLPNPLQVEHSCSLCPTHKSSTGGFLTKSGLLSGHKSGSSKQLEPVSTDVWLSFLRAGHHQILQVCTHG
jgi:hypothetical protein